MAQLGPNGEFPNRGLITVMIMLATVMQVLDTTIANVALPSMTGDLGASQDTITWVLTSYIVAAAIMTPVTGWLASVVGGDETPAFHRHNWMIQQAWGEQAVPICESLSGLNHFSVLESLALPGQRLHQLALDMLLK